VYNPGSEFDDFTALAEMRKQVSCKKVNLIAKKRGPRRILDVAKGIPDNFPSFLRELQENPRGEKGFCSEPSVKPANDKSKVIARPPAATKLN
jgi:hypothetical protein